jgi:hypothetical protein
MAGGVDMCKVPFGLQNFSSLFFINKKEELTFSNLFVGRDPSKWYLNRSEIGSTSAWRGNKPSFSSHEISTFISFPLQPDLNHSSFLSIIKYLHALQFENFEERRFKDHAFFRGL